MKKVAIVGGGPAGLSAAIEGAKNGLDITLYEKYKIGENIRCAEGFFDSLNILGKPKYGVEFKVEEIILHLKSEYCFPCEDKMNIWMIDRPKWQKSLAEQGRALGINIIEDAPINKEDFKKIMDKYDWVIDSTGVPSITSLVYGFNKYYSDTSVITGQYKLEGDFKKFHNKIKAGFEEHYLGYYWIFPKSDNEANVGVGWLDSSNSINKNLNIWNELDRILQKEGIHHYTKISKKGGLCPVKKLDTLVYKNVLLTGDAAGLASPLHGGGIDTACISGEIATQCILNDKVNSYENEIDRVLGKKINGDKALFEWWRSVNNNELENVIKILCSDKNSKLEFKDLFNGTLSILKNIKYAKNADILSLVKNFCKLS